MRKQGIMSKNCQKQQVAKSDAQKLKKLEFLVTEYKIRIYDISKEIPEIIKSMCK